jgi:two-component system, response regulator
MVSMVAPNPTQEVDLVVVDDNPHDVEFMLRALRRQHVQRQILVLRDGAEAVEFLLRQGTACSPAPTWLPRLILLDLKLPKLDGLEVLRRIKSDDRTRLIPVVVLTSSNEETDIRACYRLGANSYVVKPIEFAAFVRRVVEVGQYWLHANVPPR